MKSASEISQRKLKGVKIVNIVIFGQHYEDYIPINRTRPPYELRCGSISLGDRIARHYSNETIFYQTRDHIAHVYKQTLGSRGIEPLVNMLEQALNDDVLIIDGAILATKASKLPEPQGKNEIGVIREIINYKEGPHDALTPIYRERLVYLRLNKNTARGLVQKSGPNLNKLIEEARKNVKTKKLEDQKILLMTYPWLLIEHNGETVTEDFELYRGKSSGKATIDKWVSFLKKGEKIPNAREHLGSDDLPLYFGEGATVGPFVSFDVSEGPIIIEDNVTIEPHCSIKGPSYIGNNSTVWTFTDLKEGCSLGQRSRVCGQLEKVISQGYFHKFHVGFIGHSYIGEGVNIGEQTVTSNLKNDRTSIVMHLGPAINRRINTGLIYAGTLFGDGVAVGTNTNLITGAVVEPLSNIVSSEATPKYVNGFLYKGKHLPWSFKKAYGAVRIIMEERLGRKLPDGYETLLKDVYDSMRDIKRELRRKEIGEDKRLISS